MNAETFERLLKQAVPDGKAIREIRIRAGKPVMIWTETGENVLFSDGSCGQMENCGEEEQKLSEERELFKKNRKQSMVSADQELIRGILEICSRHSLYAYEREISQGFLTIRGGHRIGITGKAVVESGHVKTVRDISSLNIRIAHEIKGCAKSVLPHLLSGEEFLDTLVISPPGAGKTTLLRDLIRELSSGGSWGSGKNVSVVDERSEIESRGHAHDAALHGTAGTGGRRSGRGGGDPGDEIRDEMRVPDPRHGPWSGHGGHHETSGVERHRGRKDIFPICGPHWGTDTWNCGGDL